MSIKPDTWIKKMCKEHNMIEPFLDHQVSEGKISYGLSSMGYDVRISDEYRIFTNVNSSLVDPKNFSDENFIERKGPYCIIPPNSFVLAKTIEYFRIPKDVLCICVGKSTYARTGIICNVTPIENEFEGNINGSMTLQAAPLGPQAHQLEVSAICFSEPGSDLCTLAVNGSHVIDKFQEIEVSLFTTTLNEFTNNEDHIISSPGEGMVLTHKVDLDGDGEFEIGEGEISFYTWLDGAAALPAATLDQETASFSAGLTSGLGAKLEMSGAVSFADCD